jgi:hypothetical protein
MTPLLLGMVVFVLHALMTGGHLQSPDETLLHRMARGMALAGELHVLPLEYSMEAGGLMVPPDRTFATVQGRGGRFYPQYLPLQPLLAAPLVWLGEATAPLFADSFAGTLPNSPAHPADRPRVDWSAAVVVTLSNPLVAALTAVLLLRLGTFVTGGDRRAGLWMAVAWAFGTMAWAHSRTFFTEPLAGLFALVALEQILRWAQAQRPRLLHALVIGGALAAGNWTRMDSPALALGLGLAMAGIAVWRVRDGRWQVAEAVRDLAVAGGLTVGSYLALMGFNAWRYAGAVSAVGGGYEGQSEGVKFSTPLLVGLQGYLMSPGKSIFLFSPAIVLGLWGWCLVPREQRWLAVVVAVGYAPFALAMTTWQNWDGGWCWGPRHIVQLHAPVMLGMVFLVTTGWSVVRRTIARVLIVVGAGVSVFGSLQSPMDFYLLFYRTPDDEVHFPLPYRPEEEMIIRSRFVVERLDFPPGAVQPERTPVMTLRELPAPLTDSLYVPQHTQWAGYPVMLQLGYCDLWVLGQVIGNRPQVSPYSEGLE